MRSISAIFLATLLSNIFAFDAEAQRLSREEEVRQLVGYMDSMLVPPKDRAACERYAHIAIGRLHDERLSARVHKQQTEYMRSGGCFDEFSYFVSENMLNLSFKSLPDELTSGEMHGVAIGVQSSKRMMLPKGVVYVRVTTFLSQVATPTRARIEKYVLTHNALPKLIILDLRNNPGGNAGHVAEFLGLFAPRGGEIMFSLVPRVGAVKTFITAKAGPFANIAIAALVNEKSASASEIAAGVLGQYWGKVVVGRKTRGKGVYQNWYDIGDRIKVGLTDGSIFLGPNKKRYHGNGIYPDMGMVVDNGNPTYDENDHALFRALAGFLFQ